MKVKGRGIHHSVDVVSHPLGVVCFADPYLNADAGTMSPFEHGEVFVLDDGGEVTREQEGRDVLKYGEK